jgi:predicted nucleic acid-binding Zn ribbon protein
MTWKPFRAPSFETDSVPVRRSLERLAKKLGSGTPDAMAVVFDQWEATVGAEVAANANPESLADGVLVVVVNDPMWLSQMKWMTSGIVESINRKAGTNAVERVELRIRRRSAP